MGLYAIWIWNDEFMKWNSKIVSEWGILAVCGLRRLQDLAANVLDDDDTITDDANATACHMLRRYLLARVLSMLVLQSGSAPSLEGRKSIDFKASEKL